MYKEGDTVVVTQAGHFLYGCTGQVFKVWEEGYSISVERETSISTVYLLEDQVEFLYHTPPEQQETLYDAAKRLITLKLVCQALGVLFCIWIGSVLFLTTFGK